MMAMMQSHLFLLVLFAFFVSLVFAVIAKDDVARADEARRADVRRLRRVGARARLADVSVSALGSRQPCTPSKATDARRAIGLRWSCRSTTTSSPTGCRPARSRRCPPPAPRPTSITIVRVPGAFEIPLAAQHAAESGRYDADHLSRLPDSGRDAAHGVHRVGGCRRARRRGRRHRRADVLRRAHDEFGGGGARARRRRSGEQGTRSGGRRHRDGVGRRAADAPAGGARRDARAQEGSSAIAPARRRCRSSISGTSAAATSSGRPRRFSRCSGRTPIRRPTRCASSRRRWPATRWRGSTTIDPLIADTAERWRPERMAILDRLILRMAVCEMLRDRGDAGRRGHQRSARAGAHVQHGGVGEVHQRDARCDRKKLDAALARSTDTRSVLVSSPCPPWWSLIYVFTGRTDPAAPIESRGAREARRRDLPAPVRPAPHDFGAGRASTASARTTSSKPIASRRRRAAASSRFGRSARRTSSSCPTASPRIQVYIRQDALPPLDFQIFKLLDFGDWVGVEGRLFRTKTNEFTIWASRLHFLVEVPAAAAGEVARPDRYRNPVPPALPRSRSSIRTRAGCSRRGAA